MSVHCLLVLLTGIPGAGKSSFAREVIQEQRALGDIIWLALDDYMERTETEVSSTGGGTDFTPDKWQKASQKLFECVRAALIQRVASCCTSTMILVEDNMHYRSMRYKYWRLCREIAPNNPPLTNSEDSGRVNMLEARFTVPLVCCLAHNATRYQTPSYIPPSVITSMFGHFEHCLAEPRQTQQEPLQSPWMLADTTQPWMLATLNCKSNCPLPTTVELCRGFTELLQSSVFRDARKSQTLRVVPLRAPRERVHGENRASYASALHILDLRLRASVSTFLHHTKGCEDIKALAQGIQHLKKQHLIAFRAAMQDCVEHTNDAMPAVDCAVAAFEESLSQLLYREAETNA